MPETPVNDTATVPEEQPAVAPGRIRYAFEQRAQSVHELGRNASLISGGLLTLFWLVYLVDLQSPQRTHFVIPRLIDGSDPLNVLLLMAAAAGAPIALFAGAFLRGNRRGRLLGATALVLAIAPLLASGIMAVAPVPTSELRAASVAALIGVGATVVLALAAGAMVRTNFPASRTARLFTAGSGLLVLIAAGFALPHSLDASTFDECMSELGQRGPVVALAVAGTLLAALAAQGGWLRTRMPALAARISGAIGAVLAATLILTLSALAIEHRGIWEPSTFAWRPDSRDAEALVKTGSWIGGMTLLIWTGFTDFYNQRLLARVGGRLFEAHAIKADTSQSAWLFDGGGESDPDLG